MSELLFQRRGIEVETNREKGEREREREREKERGRERERENIRYCITHNRNYNRSGPHSAKFILRDTSG